MNENVERKSETKEGTEQKQKKKVFLSEFFVVFLEEKKRILKVLSKIVENKTDFFRSTMFLNQENRNRKQKESFSHISGQKSHSYFLDTSKRRKKRNRVEKKNQKKRRVIKTRNHFSRLKVKKPSSRRRRSRK